MKTPRKSHCPIDFSVIPGKPISITGGGIDLVEPLVELLNGF